MWSIVDGDADTEIAGDNDLSNWGLQVPFCMMKKMEIQPELETS